MLSTVVPSLAITKITSYVIDHERELDKIIHGLMRVYTGREKPNIVI